MFLNTYNQNMDISLTFQNYYREWFLGRRFQRENFLAQAKREVGPQRFLAA
jgi:hypothetical protein